MIFTPTKIDGVCIVSLEPVEDERGWFAERGAPKNSLGTVSMHG